MVDYKLEATPAKVIQLEEIYQRLDRLEKHAQVECYRCEKVVSFNQVSWVLLRDEYIILCPDCASGHEDLIEKQEREQNIAFRKYLKEIRIVKYNLQGSVYDN